MAYTLTLITILISLAGVIAYAGDRLGTFIGRKRLSIFGMRPKRSGQVIGIVMGVIIMLTTLGISSLAFREAASIVLSAQQAAKHLRTLEQEKEQLNSELGNLKQETLDLQQEIVFFRQELRQTRQSLRSVVNERDDAENKLEEVNNYLVKAQEDLQNVELELKNAHKERESALEAAKVAQQEMATLQTQVSETENHLTNATKELATLQVQLLASQHALQNSQEQLREVEEDLVATQEEFALQQRLIADLKFKGQNTRTNLTILQWQAQQLQDRIFNLSVQAAELRQQNNSLTVANEVLAKDNHSLEVLNQALEGENANLQGQIVTLNEELSQSSEELEEARAEVMAISKRALSFEKGELIYSGVISSQETSKAYKQFVNMVEVVNDISRSRGAGEININSEEVDKLIEQVVNSLEQDIVTFISSNHHIGPTQVNITLSVSENRKIVDAGQLISSHQFFIAENSPQETIRNEVSHLNSKTNSNLRSMGMLATVTSSASEVSEFSSLLSQLNGTVVIGAVAEDEIYAGEEASVCFVVLR